LREKAGGLADEERDDILASRPCKPSMIGKLTNFEFFNRVDAQSMC